jgi:hypothetical protein
MRPLWGIKRWLGEHLFLGLGLLVLADTDSSQSRKVCLWIDSTRRADAGQRGRYVYVYYRDINRFGWRVRSSSPTQSSGSVRARRSDPGGRWPEQTRPLI